MRNDCATSEAASLFVDCKPCGFPLEEARDLITIYDDLNFASDRLSTQIRTLTLGVLALVWLFLSGGKEAPALKLVAKPKKLLAIAGICILTLLIETVQYWAFYLSSNAVRKEAEDNDQREAEYDETSRMRRLQQGCFWAKQITALIATGWLLVTLLVSIIQ